MEEDFELTLFDRINVIRDTINKYGEENFYLSFSGGKDSTALHYLIDEALPNNRIPRVYANTGIEYNSVINFVKELQKNDDRIVIIQPKLNIKQTLEKYGYPFKAKAYSNVCMVYRKHKENCDEYFNIIDNDPKLKWDYDFVHNLPVNVKYVMKQYYGLRERERSIYIYDSYP